MTTDRLSDPFACASAEMGSTDDPLASRAERRQTRPSDPRVVVGQLLVEMRDTLESRPESRMRRRLLGELRRFDTAVARWTSFPPHDEQVAAMLDVLNALHGAIPADHGTSDIL